MKFLSIVAICLSLAVTPVYAGGVWKTVCRDRIDKSGKVVKDNSGKVVKDCKKIKVHKKLVGKKVPVKQ